MRIPTPLLRAAARRLQRWAGALDARARRAEGAGAAEPAPDQPTPAHGGASPARSGGPPEHWLERVRQAAPGLLAPRDTAEVGPGTMPAPTVPSRGRTEEAPVPQEPEAGLAPEAGAPQPGQPRTDAPPGRRHRGPRLAPALADDERPESGQAPAREAQGQAGANSRPPSPERRRTPGQPKPLPPEPVPPAGPTPSNTKAHAPRVDRPAAARTGEASVPPSPNRPDAEVPRPPVAGLIEAAEPPAAAAARPGLLRLRGDHRGRPALRHTTPPGEAPPPPPPDGPGPVPAGSGRIMERESSRPPAPRANPTRRATPAPRATPERPTDGWAETPPPAGAQRRIRPADRASVRAPRGWDPVLEPDAGYPWPSLPSDEATPEAELDLALTLRDLEHRARIDREQAGR